MTLKQLIAFYWICNLGSFSAAAAKLNTTQSTISIRIRELEDQLGVQVLDRDSRSTRPTLKGRELLVHVDTVIKVIDKIVQTVGDPNVLSATLKMGVTEFVAITWLPDLLHAVNDAYPRVRMELDVDLTSSQLRKLEAGEIDFALLPGPVDLDGAEQVAVGDVEFCWMASPGLNIPAGVLTPSDLLHAPILTTVKSSNLHHVMSDFLGSEVHLRSSTVCNTIGVMGTLTLGGIGIGFLPRKHYAPQVEAGLLRMLTVEPAMPPLRYFAVYDGRRAAPIVRRICALAQSVSTFDCARPAGIAPA